METGKKELRRQLTKQKRKQAALRQNLTRLGGILIVGAIIAFLALGGRGSVFGSNSEFGTNIKILEEPSHLNEGTPIEYSTSPPVGGPHYNSPMSAGFYKEGDDQLNLFQPEGYIVHALEHGYVAIWYNCSTLSPEDCDGLKEQVQNILDENSFKIIAFPWSNMTEEVVMTSWEMEYRFPNGFNQDDAVEFIKANRSNPRAPEPNVP